MLSLNNVYAGTYFTTALPMASVVKGEGSPVNQTPFKNSILWELRSTLPLGQKRLEFSIYKS